MLVDDFHFVVLNYIFVVFFEQCVCLQQLVYGVYSFRFDGVVLQNLVFFGLFFFGRQVLLLQFGHFGADVGQYKELRVFGGACQHVDAFVGEFYRVVLLVDDE